MIALIDGDILRYEIGSIGNNNGPDQPEPMHFDRVAEYLDQRIEQIMHATEAYNCIIFLTDGSNFRDEIAVTKPYKGNRKQEKPYHFKNITAYLYNTYHVMTQDGLEADDLMSVFQINSLISSLNDGGNTVICTRDKDLRMIPGWHYGWECGHQPELHKHWVDRDGDIVLDNGKIRGNGLAFFYSQLLTGDAVDNIPGLPRVGPAKAFDILGGLPVNEMFQAVREEYHNKGYDDEYLLEQGRLLWMTREMTDTGEPVLWRFPN